MKDLRGSGWKFLLPNTSDYMRYFSGCQ